MQLQVNKYYSIDDILNFLEITRDQWKKNRQKYLDHLCKFYKIKEEQDPNDKRRKIFFVSEKIKDYEPLRNKKEENMIIIENKILEILLHNNIQTKKSICRILLKNNDITNMKYTESTLYSKVNIIINKLLEEGKIYIVGKVWRGVNIKCEYCTINDDDYTYLKELFSKLHNCNDNNIIYYSDVTSSFMTKTGTFPIKIPIYETCKLDESRPKIHF